jgi:hypothetical protein
MERKRNHAAYFLLSLTYILSLVSRPSMILLAILPLVGLHGYTVDATYSKMLSRKLGVKEVLLLTISVIPYLFLLNEFFLIPGVVFLLAITFSYLKVNVVPQLLGTMGLTLLYLPWVALRGRVGEEALLLFLLWNSYTFTEALYVEYKLPFRGINLWYLRASWLVSLLVTISLIPVEPLSLVALVEPTIRFMWPGGKLEKASQIRELGRRGSKRTLLFFSILLVLALIKLAFPHFPSISTPHTVTIWGFNLFP